MVEQEIGVDLLKVCELSYLFEVNHYFSWYRNFEDGDRLGYLQIEKQWKHVLCLALHEDLGEDLNNNESCGTIGRC